MRVCVIQRRGVRYFSKFTDIGERDRLEVELRVEDKDNKVVLIDLTSALLGAYANHPEIEKVSPTSTADAAAAQTRKPLAIKKSQTVSPAYLSDSKKEKDKLIAEVREAQMKAAEEKKQKKADLAAARAETLAKARKAKKEAASKKKSAATNAKRSAGKKTSVQGKPKGGAKKSRGASRSERAARR